jgi:hypothetical protein
LFFSSCFSISLTATLTTLNAFGTTDAGTGLHSIKWVQSLKTSAIVAITADVNMRHQLYRDRDVASRLRTGVDKVVVGNWMDAAFCETLGSFDTILADYLIGAVDGFSPYEQDVIMGKYAIYVQNKNTFKFYMHSSVRITALFLI